MAGELEKALLEKQGNDTGGLPPWAYPLAIVAGGLGARAIGRRIGRRMSGPHPKSKRGLNVDMSEFGDSVSRDDIFSYIEHKYGRGQAERIFAKPSNDRATDALRWLANQPGEEGAKRYLAAAERISK